MNMLLVIGLVAHVDPATSVILGNAFVWFAVIIEFA
jgi:hypothetical protein